MFFQIFFQVLAVVVALLSIISFVSGMKVNQRLRNYRYDARIGGLIFADAALAWIGLSAISLARPDLPLRASALSILAYMVPLIAFLIGRIVRRGYDKITLHLMLRDHPGY